MNYRGVTIEGTDDDSQFKSALMTGSCDVIDSMLSKGYIPDRSSILEPCRYGDIDMVTRLLSCGADMDVQGGFTQAVIYGHMHLLNNLYLAGANVNHVEYIPQYGGSYSLLYSVDDPEICQWLLDMGAVQTPNELGQTPLLIACIRQRRDVAKVLIRNGAQQIPDEDGNTALSVCMEQNDTEMIKLLSSHT